MLAGMPPTGAVPASRAEAVFSNSIDHDERSHSGATGPGSKEVQTCRVFDSLGSFFP